MSKARQYIENLASRGRYSFGLEEFCGALGVSPRAARMALGHLGGQVASPTNGFWVIVPPEYRRIGCLPAEQFIPNLMHRLGLDYYAGLLTAAQFHGAAHHRPQTFQVVVARNRRPILCGSVRVDFIARRRVAEIPAREFNTPRGVIRVSSPEATAVDLVGHPHYSGGLDHVATVLDELAVQCDALILVEAARLAPLPWAQRLGFLLERLGKDDLTGGLRDYVRASARNVVPLSARSDRRTGNRANSWRVLENTTVHPET